ncbi:glycosyltransferase [Scatolibacter rhodanostii]|uniref:glycosyltransferase n=1 Tax=Scatolibacter rhodanostii TaxID=2014781 RepID=UPI00135647AF|nr:glycosyltransferase [Scatolibacter rhodanostii]
MKKILFLINNLGGGGAEKVLLTLVNHLCEHHEITVQTIFDEGVYRSQLDKRIQYETIVKKPSRIKKSIVYRLLKYLPASWVHELWVKDGYDVEIGFLEGPCNRLASAASSGVNNIAWIHTDVLGLTDKESGFYSKNSEKDCYDRFHHVVCVSQEAKSAFIEKVSPEKEPMVLYNPIDRHTILHKASENTSLYEKKDRFAFCTVGRLVPPKGIDRLLEAAARLAKEFPDFDLLILGEGSEKEALQKQAETLQLQGQVHFIGFLDNPYAVMNQCDVFVCSSRMEGYSLVVAEALVLGLPVVSTDCGGPKDLLNQGEYGLMVENSVDGIYLGMKKMLTDRDFLEEMKQKAQQRGNIFSLEDTIKKVEELL